MSLRTLVLAVLCAFGLAGAPAQAAPTLLFFDSLQGTLSSSNWATNYSGKIVADPLNAGQSALAFTTTRGGGDLFSTTIAGTGAGVFTIGFNYYGACGHATNCGGFVGVNQPGEHWLAADTSFGGLVTTFTNTGAWQWVTFSFTATGPFQVKLEDWNGSAYAYGWTAGGGASAYFRNLEVAAGAVTLADPMSAVPEPATMILFSAAVLGLGALRRARRRA
jgi:hypothetical protein